MIVNLKDYFGGHYDIFIRKSKIVSIWMAEDTTDKPKDEKIINVNKCWMVFVHIDGSLYTQFPSLAFKVIDKDAALVNIKKLLEREEKQNGR